MNWNNGAEYRRFKKEDEERRQRCKSLNMSRRMTRRYCGSYREEFHNERRHGVHNQPLDLFQEGMEDEGRNPLSKRFLEAVSVEMGPDRSNPFWWVDTLESEELIRAVSMLTEEEKMLVTLLGINEYRLEDAARFFGLKLSTVKDWQDSVYAKIRALLKSPPDNDQTDQSDGTDMCLCKRCAQVFYESGDHIIIRKRAYRRPVEVPCQICLFRYSRDYIVKRVRPGDPRYGILKESERDSFSPAPKRKGVPMLRLCTPAEFEQHADFAYGLAEDKSKSSYPTYCDGIKTKDMFRERAMKAFERDTERMLLIEQDGKVQGFIHFFWIPQDRYLQTILFLTDAMANMALEEFLAYVREHFKGYDLYMGFPAENETAVDLLKRNGFECIENDWNNTAFLNGIVDLPQPEGMVRVGRENYELFRALHSRMDGEMYWDSERILGDIDNWRIFVKEEGGKPKGAVYYVKINEDWSEIFGVDTEKGEYDPETFKELLVAAVLDAKNRKGRFMTFFCEEEYEQAAVECGFSRIGNYLCYKMHLEEN